MVDMVDKATGELEQLSQRVVTQTVQSGVRLSVNVGAHTTQATMKAVAAIWRRASTSAPVREGGQLSLKDFTRATEGSRSAVKLDDAAVSKAFEHELKKHGVTWAVEKMSDGSRTYHVQGKDLDVVQRSLATAAQRIDERIIRKHGAQAQGGAPISTAKDRTRSKVNARITQKVAERKTLSAQVAERKVQQPKLGDGGIPPRPSLPKPGTGR